MLISVRFPFFSCVFLLLFSIPFLSVAHTVGQNYIYLRIYENTIEGRFEMNMKDVNLLLGTQLDQGPEKVPKMGDIETYIPQIQSYITTHSEFQDAQRELRIRFEKTELINTRAGTFVLLFFQFEKLAEVPDEMKIRSEILFDQDPSQECWLMIEYNWKAGIYNNEAIPSLIFDPGNREQTLSLTESSLMRGFMAMIYQGMKHIWIGLDHILFLLALVLPAVITRRPEEEEVRFSEHVSSPGPLTFLAPLLPEWAALPHFRPAFFNVLKVVTFFTIAHTITLSLAALNIIVLPGRLVESIIAFSIALAAFHNIRPRFRNEWMIVFGFGLFHGFGFASVLGDIGLTGEYLTLSLLGFNLGVEIGQIVIIFV